MKAIVVYESLTGNTRDAGELIAAQMRAADVPCVACPVDRVDLQALSEADLVIVGSWVDGLFIIGQKPGRPWRIGNMPVIDGKLAAVYCTYALNPGKTLEKLGRAVEARGGDVIGGYAIKRNDLAGGAAEFTARLLESAAAEALS